MSFQEAEAALAAEIRGAYEAGEPVRIIGGGTRQALGGVVDAPRTVSTAALSGISLYEPGALTMVAGAGTPLAEIEAALAAEGQRLAFEPMDHRALLGSSGEPTIGAVAAMNNSGPRRIQAGACRDAMLGARFIDGRGDVISNGGRVMKNVTGYDLVKLMAGSWGALGVITEVSLKVLPAPEASATVLVTGLNDVTAVSAMSAALGSPFDVTGAAHLPGQVTMVRVEGFASSVTYRAERLRELLTGFGAVEIDEGADWAGIRDVAPFCGRDGAVWRVSVKPSDGPAVAEVARSCGGEAFFDWGGGLVWLLMPEDGDAGAGVIRGAVAKVGGHATLVRASEAVRAVVPAFMPEHPVAAALSARLRAEFDPKGVLSQRAVG